MSNREIISGPLTLFLAPVGTAFPTIQTAPASPWVQLGTNGARNYDVPGVTVMHSSNYGEVRSAGATGPMVAFVEQEDLKFRVTLLDFTLEQYTYAMEQNPITTVAPATGVPGTRSMGLSRGPGRAAEFALIAQGPSPYLDGQIARFLVPRCYQSGNVEAVHTKGRAVGIQLEFTALEDNAAAGDAVRFGRLTAISAAAL